MSKLGAIGSTPLAAPTAEEMRCIRDRDRDGIFLGGDYHYAYDQYLQANRDRARLLILVDELSARIKALEATSAVEVARDADRYQWLRDHARFRGRDLLYWYLPRGQPAGLNGVQRLDHNIDEEIKSHPEWRRTSR